MPAPATFNGVNSTSGELISCARSARVRATPSTTRPALGGVRERRRGAPAKASGRRELAKSKRSPMTAAA
eukprot:CAMPEP_0180462010 /NCGR_PEP_ID=MMETSP1036_2-20121128/24180_1 /TAXON_ID=632150 /ORGANISM="Azadinium spinosum, Strain 3D9" /LENGTH=69 /DNA_ID=CAMNT_0022468761 /DNA_START=653 /DNA_END=859 /DNA_ORIENTATION=-